MRRRPTTNSCAASPRPPGRCGAAIAVFVVACLPVLLAVMFLAINAASLAEARQQLQNCADASALAAVQTLVDDQWLTGDYNTQLSLAQAARSQAQAYATSNLVLTLPLNLAPATSATANPATGDVVFGALDMPLSKTLTVGDLDSSFLPTVNTVRINARRDGDLNPQLPLFGSSFLGYVSVTANLYATATLDRDVIGFRPINVQQPLPLVPLALLTESSGQPVGSWQGQPFTDQWDFDRSLSPPQFVPGQDGLPEYQNLLRTDNQATAVLLLLGISDLQSSSNQTTFQGQVSNGVTATDLQSMGGQFVLASSSNTLTVSASAGDPVNFYPQLQSWLNGIQGQARVWPLYSSFDSGTGQATINGFVAARLVTAGVSQDSGGTTQLTLTLQPCMLSTRNAVTDASQRGVGGVTITNPYVCKVRLVE